MLFGNLSENAQKVLIIAASESKMLNHFYIGTEHLFNGFCKVEDETIRGVFEEFNIDPLIRRELRARVGVGNGPAWGNEMLFTPRTHNIAKKTDEFAKTYQIARIEPIHLMLALLKGGDGVAVRMLKDKEFDIDNIKSVIEERIEKATDEIRLYPSTQKTPFLNKIGRDITLLARQGKIDPVIGRKEDIRKIAQILTMKKKNNPVLVGEAGVGKTAVVEGLALKLIRDDIPEELKGLRIIEVSMTALLSGTKYRGDFEERALKMIDEANKNRDVILFIDEIHTMIGAGGASGAMDAANILKPVLARGEIRCIGATTMDEYRRHVEKDSALERRFQPVHIDEPTKEEALQIMQGLKESYETHYRIKITDSAIDAAVYLSLRYILSRKLPDKAIDLIDQASAKKRLKSLTLKSGDLKKIAGGIYEDGTLEVTEEDIAGVVAEWTGIPINKLTEEETEKLLKMEESLTKRVIGQGDAIKSVAHTIRTAKTGLSNSNRPIGVFLFLGPTGIGKTELARALSEFLFGDEKRMIRFDMSEYMEQHTVSKFIGAPPGYVGHEQEGQLTGAVRTHPYSVILFDEVEKAHPSIFNIFLQIFDDGRLTDSHGKRVDFTNTIIIMTSNLGSEIFKKGVLGFRGATKNNFERIEEGYNEALRKTFRPELLNRIDKRVIFRHLEKEDIRKIILKLMADIQERLKEKNLKIEMDEAIYDLLMEEGYSETYGAREMARVIQRRITEPLAEELLKDRFRTGDTIHITIESERIIFHGED